MKSNYLLIDKVSSSFIDNSNLSCSKYVYEPLSLAASNSAHSLLNTFEVFHFGALFALEKGHNLLRFFFEVMFHNVNKQIN